jgi:hypothetical protein
MGASLSSRRWRKCRARSGRREAVARVTPREVRALLEAALDEAGWTWCRETSLLLDALLVREEGGA